MTVPRDPVVEARAEKIAREGYERARASLDEMARRFAQMEKPWDELTSEEREPCIRLARFVITGEGEIEF